MALKGSSVELRQRVLSLLPAAMSDALKSEISTVGPLRLSEITAVQRQIAEAILMLDSEHQIDWPKKELSTNRTAPIARNGKHDQADQ